MFTKLFKCKSKEVKKIDTPRADIPKIELNKDNFWKIKFRDIKTGEIYVCDLDDDEAFELFMRNNNIQMIFD